MSDQYGFHSSQLNRSFDTADQLMMDVLLRIATSVSPWFDGCLQTSSVVVTDGVGRVKPENKKNKC